MMTRLFFVVVALLLAFQVTAVRRRALFAPMHLPMYVKEPLLRRGGRSLYHLGEPEPMCWKTEIPSNSSSKSTTTMLDECPPELSMIYIQEPPEGDLRANTHYEVKFRLTASFQDVNLETLKSGAIVQVPHANLHSCLINVGFCTPFVKNTPGLSTHTPAQSSNLTSGEHTFTATLDLPADSYNIIAHGRVFTAGGSIKYDVARQFRRVVLPEVRQQQPSPASLTAVQLLSAAALLTVVAVIAATLLYRNHAVIKFGQRTPLLVMCACAAVALAGTFTLTLPPTPAVCAVRPYVLVLPTIAMFGILFARVWRVWRLLANPKLARRRVTSSYVFAVTAGLVAGEAVILLVQTAAFPLAPVRTFPPGDSINFTVVCGGEHSGLFYALSVAYSAVLLIAGVFVSRESARMTLVFNEGRHIGFAIYNCFLLCALLLPLQSTAAQSPDALLIMRGGWVIVMVLSTVLSVLLPKFALIRSGVQVSASGATTSAHNTYQVVGSKRGSRTSSGVHTPKRGGGARAGEVLSRATCDNLREVAALAQKLADRGDAGIAAQGRQLEQFRTVVTLLHTQFAVGALAAAGGAAAGAGAGGHRTEVAWVPSLA